MYQVSICANYSPTIIIKFDMARKRLIWGCKHRPFVFQELPFDTICVSLLFPPGIKHRLFILSIIRVVYRYAVAS